MKHFKMKACLAVVVLAVGFYNPFCFAGNWWEEEQNANCLDQIVNDTADHSASRVNWEEGYIEVMAGGTVNMKEAVNQAHAVSIAEKTARHLAYEKLAETVSGINISSNAAFDRELMIDSNLNTSVKALIKGAREVKKEQKSFPDGSTWVEVTLGLLIKGEKGLSGPTTKWVMGKPNFFIINVNQVGATMPAVPPKPASDGAKPATPAKPAPKVVKPAAPEKSIEKYTGLIVDAGGLGGSPALFPRIVASSGSVIYDGSGLDESYLIKMGAVGYKGTVDEAKASDRVGKNPLILKAVGVSGEKKADIMIADSDAGGILGVIGNNNFLKEARVVVVMN